MPVVCNLPQREGFDMDEHGRGHKRDLRISLRVSAIQYLVFYYAAEFYAICLVLNYSHKLIQWIRM